jgi:hypothetical protein
MINALENQRCWACERLKPRSILEQKMHSQLWGKPSFKVQFQDNERAVGSSENRQAHEWPIISNPVKRKVGRPKKTLRRQNEIDASSADKVAKASASILNSADCADEMDARISIGSIAEQISSSHLNHCKFKQKHHKSLKPNRLYCSWSAADKSIETANDATQVKRKRGRPKKVKNPEKLLLRTAHSDFEEKEPTFIVHDVSSISGHFHDTTPVHMAAIRKKVGRPKKLRLSRDSGMSSEQLPDKAMDPALCNDSNLCKYSDDAIARTIHLFSKHSSKRCHEKNCLIVV